jgi:hypothetical protein
VNEGAAHPLGIAKAGLLRDAFDRLGGGLHALPRHLDAAMKTATARRCGGDRARAAARTKVAVADLDEFHRFLTQVLTRIVGVANPAPSSR